MFGFRPRHTSPVGRMANIISQIHGSTYSGSTRSLIWYEPCLCSITQGGGVPPAVGSSARIMLDKGQRLALGSNLVPAFSGAVWSGTNWTYSNGEAIHTAGSNASTVASLSESTAAFSAYSIELIVSAATAGTVNITIDSTSTTTGYGNGTHSIVVLTTGASTQISITPTTDFDGKVSSLRARKIAGYHSSSSGGTYPLLQLASNGSYYIETNEETDDYFTLAGPTTTQSEHHIFIGADLLSNPSTSRAWVGITGTNASRINKTTTDKQMLMAVYVSAGTAKAVATVSSASLSVIHGWGNATNVNIYANGSTATPTATGAALDQGVFNRALGGFDSPAGAEKTRHYINIMVDGILSQQEIDTIRNYIKLRTGASY